MKCPRHFDKDMEMVVHTRMIGVVKTYYACYECFKESELELNWLYDIGQVFKHNKNKEFGGC